MAVIGAVLGDIAGSQYEMKRPTNLDYKHCDLFTRKCQFSDDTVMTLATKSSIVNNTSFAESYRKFGRKYPFAGYGGKFVKWMWLSDGSAYNSFGNGSAMRCSYIAEHFDTETEITEWATKSAECTHNHPEGIKGAVVTAMCIYMAKTGASKEEILKYAAKQYPKSDYEYSVEYQLDEYRNKYKWNATCQGSVPTAIRCFLESEDYESFLRTVFSFKCDVDTLCAIGGGIAEEFYHGTGLDEDKLLKKIFR